MLTDRVIHTLSEYETIYFYILERDHSVIDIREQFPVLNLPETIEIAFNLGYKHPTKYGKPVPITIDFLITIETPNGVKFVARSIKTPGDINDPKVRLRLKIEEIWCEKYQIDWANVDTSSFSKEMLATLRSIRSWYRNGLIINHEFADLFANSFLKVYERNVPLACMLKHLKRKFAINDESEYDWFNYCAWSKRIPLSLHHISTINDVVILD
ncbi:MAG: TnsA endonuclease N-terminal domain-containing protein [Methylophilaceae bacterium]